MEKFSFRPVMSVMKVVGVSTLHMPSFFFGGMCGTSVYTSRPMASRDSRCSIRSACTLISVTILSGRKIRIPSSILLYTEFSTFTCVMLSRICCKRLCADSADVRMVCSRFRISIR